MSNWRFGIVVVVLNGKPPLMGEVRCSTENSPFLIIDHIHAKINRVCCAALAIGKRCMNVRKNKLLLYEGQGYSKITRLTVPEFKLIHVSMNVMFIKINILARKHFLIIISFDNI